MPNTLVIRTDVALSAHQFVDLLRRSTLAERRPVDDAGAVEQMVRHANLWATAWEGDLVVGLARSVTDFSFCCYVSDLAVDVAHQRRGIGRKLIEATRSRLGPHAKLVLLAAPAATEYYPHIGFQPHPSAWIS